MPSSLAHLRVLLVDDDADTLELSQLVLEGAGAKVEAARSVAEAVSAFKRSSPDVVVSDWNLDDGDGASLLNALKALGNGFRAIAVSGSAKADKEADALAVGYHRYLVKPISGEMLRGAVGEAAIYATTNRTSDVG
ncbi:MAG TPA: response regulator [Polyangiaceae bacterium]